MLSTNLAHNENVLQNMFRWKCFKFSNESEICIFFQFPFMPAYKLPFIVCMLDRLQTIQFVVTIENSNIADTHKY